MLGGSPVGLMTHLWYPVFISLSGRLGLWEKNERGSLSAYYIVGMCVSLLCVWCSYGKHSLWVSPFISSLITIPTGKAAQKTLSNANALSAWTHHAQAGSLPQPFYSILPLPTSPCPQCTHNLLVWLSPRETRQWTANLLINTSINYYQDSSLFWLQNNPGKLVWRVVIQAAFFSYSLVWTRSPLCPPLFYLFGLSFSLQAANWSDTLRGGGGAEHGEHANRLLVQGSVKAHRTFDWEGLSQFV